MPKRLLSVPHLLQQGDGDCLAACAAMVLAYLNLTMDYLEHDYHYAFITPILR